MGPPWPLSSRYRIEYLCPQLWRCLWGRPISVQSPPRPHPTPRKSRESVHSTLTLPPLTRFTTTTLLLLQKPPLLLHSEAKKFLSSSSIKKKSIRISIYNNIIVQDKLALLSRFLHCQKKKVDSSCLCRPG